MMSTFSLFNSRTIFLTRWPRKPTQAPTGSTFGSRVWTASLVRKPGSRAMPLISMVPSLISETSNWKQLDDKLRVGPRKNDFRAVRAAFHGLDITADAFADLVFLGRDAFPVGQQRLVFAQVNGHIRTLKTAHHSAHDVAHPVLEFRENQLFFRAADMLHQRLLGILRSNAPEAGGRDFLFQFVAQLRVGLDAAGVKNRNLVVLGK